jgi:hypothetical protein
MESVGTYTMATKKKVPRPARERTGPPAKERLAIVVTLKGSPEWKAWVDELADLCRTDTSKLIDMALVDFAKARGFKKEAPRR